MKHLKTFESFNTDFDKLNEEEGLFNWKKEKLTPEDAIKKGEELVKSNAGKRKIYSMFAKSGDEEKAKKFLMAVGYNPNIKYPKWDDEAECPDGTKGFFVDGTQYSGQGSGGRTSPSA